MKTIQEKIAIMQAYADGKAIEYKADLPIASWKSVKRPMWDWSLFDYRIAPGEESMVEEQRKETENVKNETDGRGIYNSDFVYAHHGFGITSGASGGTKMEQKDPVDSSPLFIPEELLDQTKEEKTDFTLKDGNPYVIAVDFDDCLFTNAWPYVGMPIWANIKKLKERQRETDAAIILWTCREGEELEAAVRACEKYKIELAAVNKNLSCYAHGFGGDSRKIYAHEYWDDKSVNVSPKNQIYSDAVFFFGRNQFVKAVEELAELSQAICRIYLNDRPNYENAAEEIVDVRIMLNQLELLLSEYNSQFGDDIRRYDEIKHERLGELTLSKMNND